MCGRIALAVVVVLALTRFANAASLTLLPDWFHASSVRSIFMLPDGETFMGIDGEDVFRWTAEAGRSNLGTIPVSGGPQSFPLVATKVSDDGSTIIGHLGYNSYDAIFGFMWSESSGFAYMPNSSDGAIRNSIPTAVSSNGQVIVGWASKFAVPDMGVLSPPTNTSFRWTPALGTHALGFNLYVDDVSADGTTFVGSGAAAASSPNEAIRWNEQDGLQWLGQSPESTWPFSHAQLVSDDGNVVIGHDRGNHGPQLFRWTQAEGRQKIIDAGDAQWPISISADAETIIGNFQHFERGVMGPYIDFLWSANDGLTTLPELFAKNGLLDTYPFNDPRKSHSISALSADGRTIFGMSTLAVGGGTMLDPIPTYYYEQWVLELTAAPEPSSLALIGAMAPLIYCRRRASRSAMP
jgi:hypothetical protein